MEFVNYELEITTSKLTTYGLFLVREAREVEIVWENTKNTTSYLVSQVLMKEVLDDNSIQFNPYLYSEIYSEFPKLFHSYSLSDLTKLTLPNAAEYVKQVWSLKNIKIRMNVNTKKYEWVKKQLEEFKRLKFVVTGEFIMKVVSKWIDYEKVIRYLYEIREVDIRTSKNILATIPLSYKLMGDLLGMSNNSDLGWIEVDCLSTNFIGDLYRGDIHTIMKRHGYDLDALVV